MYLCLAEWDGVDGDLLRGFRFVRVAVNPDFAAASLSQARWPRRQCAGLSSASWLLGSVTVTRVP